MLRVNPTRLKTLIKRTRESTFCGLSPHANVNVICAYPDSQFQFHTPPWGTDLPGISFLPLIHEMIIDNLPNKKQAEAQLDSSEPEGTAALEELPPSFEQATEDRLLPEPPQQDPPPAFSTYAASFFTAGNGAIVSHDPHLNEDGACLVTPD